ncbi:MAG TPA: hypothetical protein VGN96_03925, partial [Roseococcus sp.]|nr:hypothetical protein [Roseococcus sp.]
MEHATLDEAPARALGPDPSLLPSPTRPFCVLVTTDRRVIELTETERGGLVLSVEGRGNPLELDQFQAGAFKAA